MDPPLKVGVSACLLGDPVRYDGGHKLSAAVRTLERDFGLELVPLCPEVEVGMGVPREPVDLVAAPGGPRMVGRSGHDWTDAFNAWAAAAVAALPPDLSGWILKSRSPSCGLGVPMAGGGGSPGLFTRALREALPELPLVEDEALMDPDVRDAFLRDVRARATP